jgi:hypothetical protein
MPQAFAGDPMYSFSIVAQTGSVIGGYRIEAFSPPNATLNDSRHVVFSFNTTIAGGGAPVHQGVATQNAVVALPSQFVSPAWPRSFFLDNTGEVYIDGGTGVYRRPADGSTPLSLLFHYLPIPGVPPCSDCVDPPDTYAFGIDDTGGVGLVQSWQGNNRYLGTQNGVQVDSAVLPHSCGPDGGFEPYPVMSRNGQAAYFYLGASLYSWLGTTGGLTIGPGSVLGGIPISSIDLSQYHWANLGINDSGQVVFVATYGANQFGIFTDSGLAIGPLECSSGDLCPVDGVNINNDGLIAYININYPAGPNVSGIIATQYGTVIKGGDTIQGKTVAGIRNDLQYFLNNHNDIIFWVEFSDGTQAIVVAMDTSPRP